ncbi:hypothetical protein BROUX41_001740 [Berkeleyomyces rouxiae]|uniref:uncharacterized protein n=1 Tax=Berkeleyomyces rouxiae TaxID=2035830 RepID=UPI003B7FC0E4
MPTPTFAGLDSLDAEVAQSIQATIERATQVAQLFDSVHAVVKTKIPSISDPTARDVIAKQLTAAHSAIADGSFATKFNPDGGRSASKRQNTNAQNGNTEPKQQRGPQTRSFSDVLQAGLPTQGPTIQAPPPPTAPLPAAPFGTPTSFEGSPLNHAAPSDITRFLNNIPDIKNTVLRVHPMRVGFAVDPIETQGNEALIQLARNRDAIMSALSAELRVVPPTYGYIVSRIPKDMFCPEAGCIAPTTVVAVARIAKDETGVQPSQVVWSKHYDPDVNATITAVTSFPEAVGTFHIRNSAPSRAQQLRSNVDRCEICHDYAHPTRYCRRRAMCGSCGLRAHAGACTSPVRCVNCLSLEHSVDCEKCPVRPVIVRGGVFSPSGEERRRVRHANRRSNKKSVSNDRRDEAASIIANASVPIPGFVPAPPPSAPSSSVIAGDIRGPTQTTSSPITDCIPSGVVVGGSQDCSMGGTAPSRRLRKSPTGAPRPRGVQGSTGAAVTSPRS